MANRMLAAGLGFGRNAWLLPLDLTFRTVGLRYGWLKSLFDHAPPRALAMTGRLRAERAAWRAVQQVPGYRAYLRTQDVRVERLVPAGILEKLPETDKASYIDRYPLEERCIAGKIPFAGTTIDESSGSTGTAGNPGRASPPYASPAAALSNVIDVNISHRRVLLASAGSVFLVALANFTSTALANGSIWARRVR